MKKVLFVDDEPEVLRGLELAMELADHNWETAYVDSGQEALERMEAKPFDAIVTDMRMPGMSGGDLIEAFHNSYPAVARIVLSGQSSREATFRTVHPMHLYLAKPCEIDIVQSAIHRALTLQNLLNDSQLKLLAGKLTNLPTRPALYDRITTEMQSPDCSIRRVGEIVAEDVAMSAKLLQLANSARFGLRREVSDMAQAAIVLGMDTVRDFVLAIGVTAQFSKSDIDMDQFCDRCLMVAKYASAIASHEGADKSQRQEAFTAGLLHDIGQLVLIDHAPAQYREVLANCDNETSLWDAERESYGTDHPSVGAFVLGQWGLPQSVVEAVGYHHHPDRIQHKNLLPVTAVHVAAAFERRQSTNPRTWEANIDENYLAKTGHKGRLAKWEEICAEKGSKKT